MPCKHHLWTTSKQVTLLPPPYLVLYKQLLSDFNFFPEPKFVCSSKSRPASKKNLLRGSARWLIDFFESDERWCLRGLNFFYAYAQQEIWSESALRRDWLNFLCRRFWMERGSWSKKGDQSYVWPELDTRRLVRTRQSSAQASEASVISVGDRDRRQSAKDARTTWRRPYDAEHNKEAAVRLWNSDAYLPRGHLAHQALKIRKESLSMTYETLDAKALQRQHWERPEQVLCCLLSLSECILRRTSRYWQLFAQGSASRYCASFLFCRGRQFIMPLLPPTRHTFHWYTRSARINQYVSRFFREKRIYADDGVFLIKSPGRHLVAFCRSIGPCVKGSITGSRGMTISPNQYGHPFSRYSSFIILFLVTSL